MYVGRAPIDPVLILALLIVRGLPQLMLSLWKKADPYLFCDFDFGCAANLDLQTDLRSNDIFLFQVVVLNDWHHWRSIGIGSINVDALLGDAALVLCALVVDRGPL